MKEKMRFFALALAMLMIFSCVALAQTSRGSLSGTVVDPSDAVIKDAKVTLENLDTKVKRETVTNSAGIYRFDAVDLGAYKVTVEASGFSTQVTSNVNISANLTTTLDFNLKVGGGGEVITVEGSAQDVLPAEPVRGESISSRKISDLPLVGQNSLNLLLTAPGVI